MVKFWVLNQMISVGRWICEKGVDMADEGHVDICFEVSEESNEKFVDFILSFVYVIVFFPLFYFFTVILFACTPGM